MAIIASGRKSEGQLMEIGATLAAHKPLYVFVHDSARGVSSHLPKLATEVHTWLSDEDLASKVASIRQA